MSDSSKKSGRLEAGARQAARILVAEDDPDFRELLSDVLRRDYDVTCVADGQRALAALQGGGFDLAVVDIMMPGLTGLELLEELQRLGDGVQTRVIIASGLYESVRDREELQATFGAVGVLHKPFTVDQLLGTVAGALDAPLPRQATRATSDARVSPTAGDARTVRYHDPAAFIEHYETLMAAGTIFIETTRPTPLGAHLRLQLEIPASTGGLRRAELVVVVLACRDGAAVPGVEVRLVAVGERGRRSLEAAVADARTSIRAPRPIKIVTVGAGDALLAAHAAAPAAEFHVRKVTPGTLAEGALDPPDLFFVEGDPDLLAPGLQAVRDGSATAGVPIVAWGPADLHSSFLEAGATDFFAWPQERDRLLATVAGMIDRAQKRRWIRVRAFARVALAVGAIRLDGTLVDISEGGVGVRVHGRIEPGTRVDLTLKTAHSRVIRTGGQVAWAQEAPGDPTCRVGIAFTDPSVEAREQVRGIVRQALEHAEYAAIAREEDDE